MVFLKHSVINSAHFKLAVKAGFDISIAALSVVLAFALRLGGQIEPYLPQILNSIPVYAVICAGTFYAYGLYKGLWRYASMADLLHIVKAVTVAQLIFIAVTFNIVRLENFPRSVILIQWLLMVAALLGARLAYRAMLRLGGKTSDEDSPRRVLVVGTDDSVELFIMTIKQSPLWRYRIVGIIDSVEGKLTGRTIHGLRILGSPKNLSTIVESLAARGLRPDTIIFSASVFAGGDEVFHQFAHQAEELGLRLTRLPPLTDLRKQIEGNELTPQSLTIEDLLGRPQKKLDTALISRLVQGRRVLITGSGGSIGGELARQVASFSPAQLTLLDHSEYHLYEIEQAVQSAFPLLSCAPVLANVRSAARILEVFQQHKPEIVFHAAALKHVPIVETNACEGILTNVIGTRNVADATQAVGALAMVLISTDKAVNPTNVMGATKRLAEYYCQALDLVDTQPRCHFMTVRFGNVIGSSGSVVPLFRRQIEAGGPVTVTHPEMERYFMSIPEAVGLVLQAAAHGIEHNSARGKIFVLDMGEPVKILDVAKRMIRMMSAGQAEPVRIVFSGLRPGEKLYEELFNHNETVSTTEVDGILSATPQPIELRVLRRVFSALEQAAEGGDEKAVRQTLKATVPGYVSSERTDEPAASALPPITTIAD